ncbi:MAG: MurR/RpiR family transcriptional regulator [Oscillospiraceae bacterium]|jgi:DNA-binding MurR/RpiR family transcriptional regulator|nr:MurR/RpiR family transcriptional regulator [Oscillospiraceae bacterium]
MIFQQIQQHYPGLSKSHRKVADFIMQNVDKAAFMTAAAIGATVGVSESTVVRFAAVAGYGGYPQLQKYLQNMIRSSLTSVQRLQAADVKLGGREDKILDRTMAADAELIRRTLEQTDHQAFAEVVQAIAQARRIYIQGTRSSATLASFLALYLNILHPDVVHVDTLAYEQMMRIGEQDMCIAISFPRYSEHTLSALRFARDRGATTVAITDASHSPIAQVSQHVLLAACDAASFVDSLVAPLSLINALLAACARSQGDQMLQTLHELEDIWAQYDVYAAPAGS